MLFLSNIGLVVSCHMLFRLSGVSIGVCAAPVETYLFQSRQPILAVILLNLTWDLFIKAVKIGVILLFF